ncbi:MAG: DUF3450 domain-containing protein [Planctomycetes bacterium]|nr:DUF3450 domain-containing protein [Planctomycetota bacterium]NUQ33833.1 DUF3450 family protein [Planctomycetaceae bacterium]
MRTFVTNAGLVALALAILTGANGDSAPVSDQVLTELEAANRARSGLTREEAEWQREKQRLELLASTLENEITKLNKERKDSEATLEILRREASNDPGDARLHERTELARECAQVIDDRLNTLSAETPPGTIPDPSPTQSEPIALLESAGKRLGEAERRAGQFAVEVVTGRLGEHERAVKLLRLGGAAAWWISLDGKEAGSAAMQQGTLVLKHAKDEQEARNIREAVEIAEGLREPRFVILPVREFEIARGEKTP